jgi:hypothetical protein
VGCQNSEAGPAHVGTMMKSYLFPTKPHRKSEVLVRHLSGNPTNRAVPRRTSFRGVLATVLA